MLAIVRSKQVGRPKEEAGGQRIYCGKELVTILNAAVSTGPPCHFLSHPLLTMLPPIVLARVAVSLWPTALLVQVRLACPSHIQNPCIQQYPPVVVGGAVVGRVVVCVCRGRCMGAEGGADPMQCIAASMV